jgi:hypothetical protein
MSIAEVSMGDRTVDITPFNSPEKVNERQPFDDVPLDPKDDDEPYIVSKTNQHQQHPTYVYDMVIACHTDKHSGEGEDRTQDTAESPFTISTSATLLAWDDCSDAGSSFVSSDFQASVFGEEAADDSSFLSEQPSISSSDRPHETTQTVVDEKQNLQEEDEKTIDFPTVQEFEDLDEIERMEIFKRMRVAFLQSYRSNVDNAHEIKFLREQLKHLDINLDPISKKAVIPNMSLNEVDSKQGQAAPASIDPNNRVQMLEKEVLNVSILLEQTIKSVERLESIPSPLFQKLWVKHRSKGTRKNEDIRHLERMCKIHQFTILKQQQELQALKNEINSETSHHQLEVESLMAQVNQYGQELSLSNNEVKTCKGVIYDLRRQITVLEDEIEALEAQMKISGMNREWMI